MTTSYISIKARWTEPESTSRYYRSFVVGIYNYNDYPIQNPLIGLTNPLFSKNVEIVKHSGTGDITKKKDTVSFSLESYLRPIPGKNFREVTLAYQCSAGENLNTLPTKFTIDGEPITRPPSPTPPTKPKNLRCVMNGIRSLSLEWDASTSSTIVTGYQVFSRKKGVGEYKISGETFMTPNFNVTKLDSDTDYEFVVYAVDISENKSEPSDVLSAMTEKELPDHGDWTVRRSPFVDFTAGITPKLMDAMNASTLDGAVLGFLVAGNGQGAEPKKVYWGGFPTLTDSTDQKEYPAEGTISNYGKKDVQAFQARGGKVVVSFGGQSNKPVEENEHNIGKIADIITGVVNNYKVDHIDFDFEGAFIANAEALSRHISAIAQVLRTNPTLQVSYTLPADAQPGKLEGFNPDGEKFLQALSEGGIEPSLIAGMLMEFGQAAPIEDPYRCCVIALEGMHTQIKKAFPKWDDAKIWRRIGACPMFGSNNNTNIVFTLQNMKDLKMFAIEKKIGNLSGWDLTRDRNQGSLPQCNDAKHGDIYLCTYIDQEPYDFAKIIMTYTP